MLEKQWHSDDIPIYVMTDTLIIDQYNLCLYGPMPTALEQHQHYPLAWKIEKKSQKKVNKCKLTSIFTDLGALSSLFSRKINVKEAKPSLQYWQASAKAGSDSFLSWTQC